MSNIQMVSRIEMWPRARLKRYARNSRTHSKEQILKIAASITEFGFNVPILVDESREEIIAGHGRLDAADLLELPGVPVIPLGHLTEAQRRAYIIADNKLAELAGWDQEMLAAELSDLRDEDFDLSLIGFSDEEIAALLEEPDEPGENEGDGDGPGGDDATYAIMVTCDGPEHQDEVLKKLQKLKLNCKLVTEQARQA